MSATVAGVAACIETGEASIAGAAATCVAGSTVASTGAVGEQAEKARAKADTAVVERIRASMGLFSMFLPWGDGADYPAMA
jgi:hypothetical protein